MTTRRGSSAALLAAVLVTAAPALADDSHYQDFVIGGRAMGLGGAFTSLADDPSGAYFNPAGIADVRQSNIQVSTSLYGFERGSINPELTLPVPGLENLDVEFTELIIIPASAGFVKTIGRPGPDGQHRHAYALSVVVPSFRSFNAGSNSVCQPDKDQNCPDGVVVDQRSTYSRRVTDRSLWTGLGYGRKIGQRLRLGISGYYVLRSAVDIEDVSTSARVDDGDGDPSNDQQIFRTARNDISYINGSVLLTAGLKYHLTDALLLGASFQTPSLQVHSQSTLRFSSGDSVPSCAELDVDPTACANEELLQNPRSRFINETINGSSETQLPATLRFGASYAKKYKWTISGDLAYHFPVDYSLIKSKKLTSEVRGRLPFEPDVEREAVLNANVGVEYLVIREVSIAAGFYTDFSSAPKIPENPGGDQQPYVNMKGLTLALGYFGPHSLSRLGVLYTWGNGQDVIPTSDINRVLESEQTFQRVDYFQSFFYVFLSSTFRY